MNHDLLSDEQLSTITGGKGDGTGTGGGGGNGTGPGTGGGDGKGWFRRLLMEHYVAYNPNQNAHGPF